MLHFYQSLYDGDDGGGDDICHNLPSFHHDDHVQHGTANELALLSVTYLLSLLSYDHGHDYNHDYAHGHFPNHVHTLDYESDHKHYLLQYDLSESFLKQEAIISLCYHLNELSSNSLFILSDW